MSKTFMAKEKDIKRKWYIVDAKDKILGRLATRIAIVLRGKHKAEYTPHIDCGDGVIVINADKIRTTGRKLKQKEYQVYSGYPGGRKTKKLETVLEHKPTQVLRIAVKGMLPHTPLGRETLKKLRVYSGESYPHAAQTPQELKL